MKVKRKSPKKFLLLLVVLVTAAAAGLGGWYYLANRNTEPVYVYPFNMVGMTEYWGDSRESYGPVSTDKIQTVFLTDTQSVTEILVQQGDTVQKGDLLMTFDTTLSDLALEKKRLEVEKLKLQLSDAQKELRRINAMKPMVIYKPSEDEETEESLGEILSGSHEISTQQEYDGSSPEKALILWVRSDAYLNNTILEEVRLTAETFQNKNAEEAAGKEEVQEGTDGSNPAEPPAEGYTPFAVNNFYVVVKVTNGNRPLATKTTWQCLRVSKSGGEFTFRFAETVIGDHMLDNTGEDTSVNTGIDFGSGFTAAQIAEMRDEQKKKITQLEFDIKMAEADYKIAQTEAGDGNVYAQIDGEVVSLLTEDEAKATQQPVLKVSGGGGFFVDVFVSELEKDTLAIGQEVTINDWNTGMNYVGTVDSIGDFPTADGYFNGMGNPNASYYPFRVFVDESADLQAGRYVNVVYSSAAGEHGIYLQNPFLRKEGGSSFVYVRGDDGRLEQRFVKTGKSLWGSYMEILEGLTAEDLVAFPYGKHVKSGAVTEEGDHSTLYE